MAENLSRPKSGRRYPHRREVALSAYPHLTAGSAHQKQLATERNYLDLIRALARTGNREKLAQLRTRVAVAEAEMMPPLNLLKELTDVQAADAVGDSARFTFVLDGMTEAGEARLLRSVHAEIAELTDLAMALEARRAAR